MITPKILAQKVSWHFNSRLSPIYIYKNLIIVGHRKPNCPQLGKGRKGKLLKTNFVRSNSETGKQVSGPKHYYALKRNNSIVHLRTNTKNVLKKQSSSKGLQKTPSTSTADFSELYKKATSEKTYSEELSLEKIPENPKIYTYHDFLLKLQKMVDDKKSTDIPISEIKRDMPMIEAEDIDVFINQMIEERKNVVKCTNKVGENILRVMLRPSYCTACTTTSNKCQTCGKKVCDLHSPDAEEKQSKRHCEPCFKK